MKWFTNLFEKQSNIREVESRTNLIGAIHYDTDWWQRKYAIEWWEKDGHFNDELYRKVLWAKLERNQSIKTN